MELNPYGTLPTLVDRDLVLFSSRIIMEYLDERFPHPPLMPVYPVSRAKSRLLMLRIEQDWYPTLEIAEKGTEVEREEALKQLKEELLAVSVIFQQTPYFMSEEFGLVDCYVAPLLGNYAIWVLNLAVLEVKQSKGYMDRVFSRDSFLQSVGEAAPKKLMDDK